MKRTIELTLLSFLIAALGAWAQTSRGTVTGIVSDPSGAAVAAAQVELRGVSTGAVRRATSNEAGLYRFDAVDLGQYVVYCTAAGFNAFQTEPFSVAAAQVKTVDARLEVGEQKTVVQVEGTATALQVETTVRGANVDTRQIESLPLAARNPALLAMNAPGVTSNRAGPGVSTFVVNGARGRSNNFLIDGTENNDISVAGQAFKINNPDAVQEVSVQTSNYDSEYGRSGGGVVNVITRSGTNSFHGTASMLLDVTNDDAVTMLQSIDSAVISRGKPMPGTEQWWAGTFGGPVVRNRTFFFQSFQEQRQRSSSTTDVLAPSAAGRAALTRTFPSGSNPRVDLFNRITGGTNAAAQFFNVALGDGRPDIEFGTAIVPYPATYRDRQTISRFDHMFNERNLLSSRFLYDDQDNPATYYNWPGFITGQKNRYMNAMLAYTRVLSPTLTNELRLPYNRITLGFPVNPANEAGKTLPLYNIGGLTSSGVGSLISGYFGVPANLPQGRIANNYGLQDTVSWTHSTHTVRAGVDLLLQRSRQFAPITERGLFSYQSGGGYTGFANFIDDFGGSNGSVQRDFGSPAYYPSLFRQAYFIQDRWRATPALTITAGLRYEYFGLPMNSLRTPAFTGLFNVDPVTFSGPYSQPNSVAADRNNFAPGLGLTWNPSARGPLALLLGEKKTVIRSGYQIGFDSFYNNIASNAATSSPNVVATSVPSTVSSALPRGLANLSTLIPQAARALTPLDSQTLMDANLRNPYYQRWSIGIQRQFDRNTMLDVSYVGSRGLKLYITETMNPVVPASLQINPANVSSIPASRLASRYDRLQGSRNIRTNNSASNYNSLQTQLTRRYSGGFTANFAYTWAKMMDYSSDVFATTAPAQTAVPPIFGGLRRERAVSLFDRTHRFVLLSQYELPWFKNQTGALSMVAGGWAVSGVFTYETGVPVNILNGQDADGIDGAYDRPIFNPNGTPGVRAQPSSASATGYINPDVTGRPAIDPATAMYIAIPANAGSTVAPTGNLGRNTFRAAPTNNIALNVFKRVRITERFSTEFRAEFYNVLNHPQRGQGSVSPFSPGDSNPSANVYTSPAGRFLNLNVLDGGGRVVRYQLKFVF